MTVASAAKLMNVGERTVERAKARMRTDPEAHKAAIRGDRPKKARKPKPVAGERGPKPKPTKPDLAELVANLNALWSTKDVNCYEPTEQQLSMLKHNGPDVVRKLQSLASRFDYAMSSSGLSLKHERALAAMVKEANGADPVPDPSRRRPRPPTAPMPRPMISGIAPARSSPSSTCRRAASPSTRVSRSRRSTASSWARARPARPTSPRSRRRSPSWPSTRARRRHDHHDPAHPVARPATRMAQAPRVGLRRPPDPLGQPVQMARPRPLPDGRALPHLSR